MVQPGRTGNLEHERKQGKGWEQVVSVLAQKVA